MSQPFFLSDRYGILLKHFLTNVHEMRVATVRMRHQALCENMWLLSTFQIKQFRVYTRFYFCFADQATTPNQTVFPPNW